MSDTFNTIVSNWQGVDEKPTAGSHNLVESGGAYENIFDVLIKTDHSKYWELLGNVNKIINAYGIEDTKTGWFVTNMIPATEGNTIVWNICATDGSACLCTYNSSGTKLSSPTASSVKRSITLPENTAYIRASFPLEYKDNIYIFDETSNKLLFAYPFVSEEVKSNPVGKFSSLLKIGTTDTFISEFDKEDAIPYFNESFIGKGLYSDGLVVNNSYGFVCDYIPVTPGDVVEWNAGVGLSGHNYFCAFKSDKTFNNFNSYDTSTGKRVLTMQENAAYIRATFSLAYKESAYLKINGKYVFAYPPVFDKLIEKLNKVEVNENKYIQILSGCTFDSTILSTGNIVYKEGKFASPYILASAGDVFYWDAGINTAMDGYFCKYDTNKNFIGFHAYNGTPREITISENNVAYIRAVFDYNGRYDCILKKNNNVILKFVESFDWIEKFQENVTKHLKVALWNVGMFEDGVATSPAGVPDANMDTVLPLLKGIFTKINADILVLEEYNEYINKGDSGATRLLTYDTLLKQFYPYYVPKNNLGIAIFSKIEIPVENWSSESEPSRPTKIGCFRLGCKTINLCACHTWGGSTANEDIVEKMSGKENVIVLGDLNTQLSSDLDAYRNDGYTLGNWGYWGELKTHDDLNYGLDNIIVKGLQMNNFQVIQEHTASDHNPVIAELSITV